MSTHSSRVVLITGCSSGIGCALVHAFAERGHHVVATARNPESIADLQGPQVTTLPLDVTDAGRCEQVVAEVVNRHGQLDILVNNAGYTGAGPLIELSPEEIRQHFEVLTVAPMVLARAAAQPMMRQRRGTIVNIGSVNALICGPFAAAYGAAKMALHRMTDVLRMELWPWDVHVVLVQAGGVRTRIRQPLHTLLDAQLARGTAYPDELAAMRDAATAYDDKMMSADTFARKLVPRLLRRRPPRLIRLGTLGRIAPLLHGLLPAAVQEWMLRQSVNMAKRPRRAEAETA